MAVRESVRPGGRSARVQAAVHQAVRGLMLEMDRAEVTIPLVAARAGVTPSTIYRRWGDLGELLADVAVERLRPDQGPTDTGSFRGDLLGWFEQYLEEMSSGPGRAMVRDLLSGGGDGRNACRCCDFTRQQLAIMTERAARRGERVPNLETVFDRTVAPGLFHILFEDRPVDADYARHLVDELLGGR